MALHLDDVQQSLLIKLFFLLIAQRNNLPGERLKWKLVNSGWRGGLSAVRMPTAE